MFPLGGATFTVHPPAIYPHTLPHVWQIYFWPPGIFNTPLSPARLYKTLTNMCAYAINAYARRHTNAHLHTSTRARTHTNARTYNHVHTHTRIYIHTNARTCNHAHTNRHAHAHTHTHRCELRDRFVCSMYTVSCVNSLCALNGWMHESKCTDACLDKLFPTIQCAKDDLPVSWSQTHFQTHQTKTFTTNCTVEYTSALHRYYTQDRYMFTWVTHNPSLSSVFCYFTVTGRRWVMKINHLMLNISEKLPTTTTPRESNSRSETKELHQMLPVIHGDSFQWTWSLKL